MKKPKQSKYTLKKINGKLKNDHSQLKMLDSSTEPTTYNWLTTISLIEVSFYLNKSIFWDNIRILYSIPLKYLPSRCEKGRICDIRLYYAKTLQQIC